MICPNCKTPNQPNAKTCWSCGRALLKEATETIDRERVGQVAKCPYCNREFVLSEPNSEHVRRTTDASHSRNKFAGKSSFRGNLMKRKFLLLGIAGVTLIASLIVLGLVFLWDSKSIKDSGHKGVQLWEGGPYWAETNIGAENPWDYGYYFWWGDTIGYEYEGETWVASDGSSSNFDFGDRKKMFTYDKDLKVLRRKGWTREDGILTPEHDAAHVHWGGKWRMPTKLELEVLSDSCDWTLTTRNGIRGYVVRGRGDYGTASIFLPCAGYGNGRTSLEDDGARGNYWSSVLDSDDVSAWALHFHSGENRMDDSFRNLGYSVRPVQGFTK